MLKVPPGLLRAEAYAGHSRYGIKRLPWHRDPAYLKSLPYSAPTWWEKQQKASRDLSKSYSHKTPFDRTMTNLKFNDLRFWSGGHNPEARYALCRSCQKHCSDMTDPKPLVQQMKEHMAETKCTQILVKAYEILSKEGACAICNVATRERKWGVPLCSNYCVKEFAHRPIGGFFMGNALSEAKTKWLACFKR